jgi:hypothetical protein
MLRCDAECCPPTTFDAFASTGRRRRKQHLRHESHIKPQKNIIAGTLGSRYRQEQAAEEASLDGERNLPKGYSRGVLQSRESVHESLLLYS